jgi:hypothetical protein
LPSRRLLNAFRLTARATLSPAVNPDFAQVEADQTVITANQRFPIFFEEKRPFFLEGVDVFRTRVTVVQRPRLLRQALLSDTAELMRRPALPLDTQF